MPEMEKRQLGKGAQDYVDHVKRVGFGGNI